MTVWAVLPSQSAVHCHRTRFGKFEIRADNSDFSFVLWVEGGKGISLNATNETRCADLAVQGAGSDVQRDVGADGIAGIFSRYVKTVYRLCYSYLGSPHDAEDAAQAVFMKLVVNPREFESVEHEKAWLLTVAANHCKDVLKSAARTRQADMPADVEDMRARVESDDLTEAVLALPVPYKDCVYLHYYEGYKTDEIAEMTGASPSTVRNRLRDARALLKAALSA